VGGLSELALVVGPVLAFAIYELIKLRRETKTPAPKSSKEPRA
jgi:hypothetical protein